MPARLVHPSTLIHLGACPVGRRQANAINRQTESCPIRVSEGTGTSFARRCGRNAYVSECPLTQKTNAYTTGHAEHPLTGAFHRPNGSQTHVSPALTPLLRTATAGGAPAPRRVRRRPRSSAEGHAPRRPP